MLCCAVRGLLLLLRVCDVQENDSETQKLTCVEIANHYCYYCYYHSATVLNVLPLQVSDVFNGNYSTKK
jgi:hypothetical protein